MPGPLHGYRIVDLSQIITGPMATLLLSDQGADVVKVEPVDGEDVIRRPNFARGGFSAFFLNNNRGKRSLAVDLHSQEGRQIILDMVATADVFVQNFRPGVCDRMGLGYEDLRTVNPDLVYVSISGFGPTGPYADRPVLDPVIQGLTGMVAYQVNPDIPFPDLVRNIVSDKSTALTVAQAITAALLARERGAGGQHVEIPMLDATLFFFWSDAMIDLTMVGDGVTPGLMLAQLYRLTECLDGKLIYFAASTAQLHGVSTAVGHPEWCQDPRWCLEGFVEDPQNALDYGQMTAEAFASMSVADALAGLAAGDVPSGPILERSEVLDDPQVLHNGSVVTWEHPEAGTVRQARPAARFSETPGEMRLSASAKGQDTDEILAGIGRTGEEIRALRDGGVVA